MKMTYDEAVNELRRHQDLLRELQAKVLVLQGYVKALEPDDDEADDAPPRKLKAV